MADGRLEHVEDWLDSIWGHAGRLTQWEREFIESVTEQWEERRSLSGRQLDILEKIYAEKTD